MIRTISLLLPLLLLASGSCIWAGGAKVIKVDGLTVYIGVGADREVKVGTRAQVYRQAGPIIHPITGEDLGSPQIKIAEIEITRVAPTFSAATSLKQFASIRVGDLIDGLDVALTAEEEIRADVVEARSEIKMLAKSLAREIKANQKSIFDLRGTLRRVASSEQRLKSLVNDVRNVREHLVVIEERIQNLEEQQSAIIAQDTAEVKTLGPGDMTQLEVLHRGEDEAIYLRIGDRKIYELSFEQNRLIDVTQKTALVVEDMQAAPGDGGADDLFAEPESEDDGGLLAYWWIAPIVGVLGAVVLLLLKIRRRKSPPTDTGGDAADVAAETEDDTGGFMEAIDDTEIPEPEEIEAVKEEQ